MIADMTVPWKYVHDSDRFSDTILAPVSRKVEAGDMGTVRAFEEVPAGTAANKVVR